MSESTKPTLNQAENGNKSKPLLTDGFLLIPMLEFVLEELKIEQSSSEFKEAAKNYAKFLKQPLTLSMFIPTDNKGNVLNYDDIKQSVIEGTEDWSIWENAQEKVLFTNTSCSFDDGVYWLILGETYISFYDFNEKFDDKILEDFAFRKDLILKKDFYKCSFL